MPKGVYRKKNKKGVWMYFRDGVLIKKSSYDASIARRKGGTRKGMVRKTARRAYTKKKGSNNKMRRTIPHPSITGMASGLAIAAYLNQGKTTTTSTGTMLGAVSTVGDSVIKDVVDGELPKAATSFANNAINLISSDAGRKTLIGASLIAVAGAAARRQWPMLKLGGSKMYFRL
jgi:hypothetical protein